MLTEDLLRIESFLPADEDNARLLARIGSREDFGHCFALAGLSKAEAENDLS
jgi:hypothetical protein